MCGYLVIACLVWVCASSRCLDNDGKEVAWWVMLNTPSSIADTRYGYYDSTMTQNDLVLFREEPSSEGTALGRTLLQINYLNLQVIAWNDEKPNGGNSSSLAHSKTVMAFEQANNRGFVLDHSIPQYPAFVESKVNITINNSQKIYGQHLLCMSLSLTDMEAVAQRLRTIYPFIYQSTVTLSNGLPELGSLSNSSFYSPNENFQFSSLTTPGLQVKAIFKNGNSKKNCSIFEDGLNNYLDSPIAAETWGRPLDKNWCGAPSVASVEKVTLSSTVWWPYTKDHSKWVISTTRPVSCFGDMNRMSSQWKRGGAFYCIESAPGLYAALLKSVTYQQCPV